MLVFDCNVCHTKLSAQDTQVGALVKCPQCHTTLRVPSDAASVGASSAASPSRAAAHGSATATIARPRSQAIPAGAVSAFRGGSGGGARRYGFNCGYCSSRLEATDAMAAQEGQCPTCGNTITIPIQDRYGRLIDPKTRQIIKQDPHPVHAYAAAGDRAPQILRTAEGKQLIRCARCGAASAITANNCKACGMPFTMEGTTAVAAGTSNGFCVASLVLGILGLPLSCAIIVSPLAILFGIIGYVQAGNGEEGRGRGLAIAGMACGGVGCIVTLYMYVLR